MNKHSEAGQIVEAEKGHSLSPRNLHLRLRVVEVVLLISLVLNLLHWYVASANEASLSGRINAVAPQAGAR